MTGKTQFRDDTVRCSAMQAVQCPNQIQQCPGLFARTGVLGQLTVRVPDVAQKHQGICHCGGLHAVDQTADGGVDKAGGRRGEDVQVGQVRGKAGGS